MKVHQQFARAFCDNNSADPNSANHTCNRLRPLIPKLPSAAADAAVDLKSFIRPDGGPRRVTTPSHSPQGEKAWWRQGQSQGGTRWNPTKQQIEILERLYRGGMRTPTAEEIEQITAQLSKYGKIEGKNVFYWFQNHKARERQKEKKRFYHAPSSPRINTSFAFNFHNSSNYKKDLGRVEEASSKRRCGTWSFGCLLPEENRISANHDHHHHRDNYTKITTPNFNNEAVEEEGEDKGHKKTLKLFPLHPEGRSMMGVSPT